MVILKKIIIKKSKSYLNHYEKYVSIAVSYENVHMKVHRKYKKKPMFLSQEVPQEKMILPSDFPAKTGSAGNHPLVIKYSAKFPGIPADIFQLENPQEIR